MKGTSSLACVLEAPQRQQTLLGFATGVWGTFARAGVGLLAIRRLTSRDAALSPTQPEHVIDWMSRKFGMSRPHVRTRRRLADSLQILVGGIDGVMYAYLAADREPDSLVEGARVASAMWVAGFCGYLPLFGMLSFPWSWRRRQKLVVTTGAHLAYGWTMSVAFTAIRQRVRGPTAGSLADRARE